MVSGEGCVVCVLLQRTCSRPRVSSTFWTSRPYFGSELFCSSLGSWPLIAMCVLSHFLSAMRATACSFITRALSASNVRMAASACAWRKTRRVCASSLSTFVCVWKGEGGRGREGGGESGGEW